MIDAMPDQFIAPLILPCGDTGISVEFGNVIDPGVNARVRRLFQTLKDVRPVGILDLIPTYRALFIEYDPCECSFERLVLLVEAAVQGDAEVSVPDAPVIEIPVCYGGDYGPDLDEVAAYHQMSVDEAIELHRRPVYTVYMIGFTPGFPYLGGLDERLVTPRKKEPRQRVPAGSVGIADRQTGIYSADSPGGWQIIGRTPATLFDLTRTEPFLLQAGDRVQFIPVSKAAFESP
jgi:KipI family sensor histidine kinase inhibitor